MKHESHECPVCGELWECLGCQRPRLEKVCPYCEYEIQKQIKEED